ncbi:hypothetical protein NP233_g8607 [Leucocoprinus birnbaumii]|uniref:SAP domain-containing protein n=1 Tax=Leucocoprinus birnbaumii TaxID=56174 RepID=A0AAD5YMZ5_9AGAR|nr:hypothetical protein NP233_g8607 [Leucocoprinus birnbaumii]
MMSETTEILFNSPALNALRRDQLQKLCKLHSIKANGKNTELIDRLREHAKTLPNDDPLSVAARSEVVADDDESVRSTQRPSEQWEVVMESIEEVEENGGPSMLRTPRVQSSGEFGSANSKTPGVSSSIRALATSLGLAKTTKSAESSVSSKASRSRGQQSAMADDLTQHSVPYSATRQATPPLHDNFTFDPTTATHTHPAYYDYPTGIQQIIIQRNHRR